MFLTKKQYNELANLYSDTGNERGGYISLSGAVVECPNESPSPDENYLMGCETLDDLERMGAATFHTHPGKEPNLSKDDYNSFLNWEKLLHFIIGKDKISCYKVSERGTVVIEPVEVENAGNC